MMLGNNSTVLAIIICTLFVLMSSVYWQARSKEPTEKKWLPEASKAFANCSVRKCGPCGAFSQDEVARYVTSRPESEVEKSASDFSNINILRCLHWRPTTKSVHVSRQAENAFCLEDIARCNDHFECREDPATEVDCLIRECGLDDCFPDHEPGGGTQTDVETVVAPICSIGGCKALPDCETQLASEISTGLGARGIEVLNDDLVIVDDGLNAFHTRLQIKMSQISAFQEAWRMVGCPIIPGTDQETAIFVSRNCDDKMTEWLRVAKEDGISALQRVSSWHTNCKAPFIGPTVRISVTPKTRSSDEDILAKFTFSKKVTGFVVGDITVTNGHAHSFAGEGSSFTASITPAKKQSTVIIGVPANVAEDSLGNGNIAAIPANSVFEGSADTKRPTVAITDVPSTRSTNAEFTAIFTFSEVVKGFAKGDITLTNGHVIDMTQRGQTFTARIKPHENTTLTVRVLANVAHDLSGNGNLAAGPKTSRFNHLAVCKPLPNNPDCCKFPGSRVPLCRRPPLEILELPDIPELDCGPTGRCTSP